MSFTDIRAGIKTKLESISGIENVNDFVIWSDDWDSLLTYFVKDGRVNTWQIGLISAPAPVLDSELVTNVYNIGLFGLYSIKTDQESSKTFEDLCLKVINEFATSINPISVAGTRFPKPPSLLSFANTIYMQSPAHQATIQMQVSESVERSLLCSG